MTSQTSSKTTTPKSSQKPTYSVRGWARRNPEPDWTHNRIPDWSGQPVGAWLLTPKP
jgi:hypothetical protein